MKTWLRGHTEVIPFPLLSCRPCGPRNCHVPTFPGPDGPGYYLTALRALCVAHHRMGTDWVLLSPDEL